MKHDDEKTGEETFLIILHGFPQVIIVYTGINQRGRENERR